MNQLDLRVSRSQEAVLETNKVLRNTYLLLSMTLFFSALMAGVAMMMNVGFINPIILLAGIFGLSFWVNKTADSAQGLLATFVFTGFLGFTLGPVLSMYLTLANGPAIIMQALGGTALIFLTLSGYALVTRKDFSYMGAFLLTGLLVAFGAAILNLFLGIPALGLAVTSAFLLLSSGMILFETSRIINGGETNYIRATVSLYVSIYNIFLSLLHLLGFFSRE